MKKSGKCPKCSSTNIKENTMGGLGNMWAGRLYRCKDCGFSEIWQSDRNQKELVGLYSLILLISLGILFWLWMGN